jgi:hypothetical protein
VGGQLAVGDHLAPLHTLPLEDVDMPPFRDQLLDRLAVVLGNDQALFALGILAKAHGTRRLRE